MPPSLPQHKKHEKLQQSRSGSLQVVVIGKTFFVWHLAYVLTSTVTDHRLRWWGYRHRRGIVHCLLSFSPQFFVPTSLFVKTHLQQRMTLPFLPLPTPPGSTRSKHVRVDNDHMTNSPTPFEQESRLNPLYIPLTNNVRSCCEGSSFLESNNIQPARRLS